MTGAALALVATAAVLHASWNALAKRGSDPIVFLWWASCGATAFLVLPGAAVLAWTGLRASGVPFVLASVVIHALYFYALGRSYGSGAFSLVYPVARGFGVALVPVVAWLVFDERTSALGTLGIVLVVAGIVALQLVAGPGGGAVATRAAAGRGTVWALATGLTIAAYSLVDKAGVARINPVPYLLLTEAGCTLVLLPVVLGRPDALRREWRLNWPTILATAAMSAAAYSLVLFAFRLSKTGYVVAARELSIVLSALIGSFWLDEGRLTPRLAGASIVLAGVACIALAR